MSDQNDSSVAVRKASDGGYVAGTVADLAEYEAAAMEYDRQRDGLHLLDVAALAPRTPEPGSAIQYSVVDADGKRHIYGDQEWVQDGRCLEDAHPGGRIERRVILITYCEWMPTTP